LVAEASLQRLGLLVDVKGDPGTDVSGLTADSRQVRPGWMFGCVPGSRSDGHAFAADAAAKGVSALLCERVLAVDAAQVVVTSVRRSLGPVADALFGRPSAELTVAGVTGTNGKTTTCAFLTAVFEAHGWPATSIGTLTNQRTTPEAPELQSRLREWVAEGGRAVALEVSSHALEQHRVDAVRFAAGVFTNLSPEHLDYHPGMEAYFEAKARLFEPGRVGLAVVNAADPWGQRLIARLHELKIPVETFDPREARDLEVGIGASTLTWSGRRMSIGLGGRFNVDNALAAAACARALGIPLDDILEGLAAVEGVRGRFELVDAGQPFTVLVDYAHTPDGLAKALAAARESAAGRLIVVFGAGGDRDHVKRPLMGEVAARLADLAVVTSDNPRSEDPAAIIADVVAGTAGRPNVRVQEDREAAIGTALAMARSGDVVVIAGKGHEQGQEVAGRLLPFDDAEVAKLALARIAASRHDRHERQEPA
jgi:UDP-N-acetylmuramoyl-L-alanyl-D-glutamate--2,6-diaminopimelate ligase